MNGTILEMAAVGTALLCVVLAVWEKRSSWILAIVSSGLYFPIFWSAELYWDAILQFFFIATAAYGFVEWGHSKDELPITQRSMAFHAKVLTVCSAVTCCLVWYTSPTNLLVGIVDAAMFPFSVAAALLLGRRIYDAWLYWLVIDTLASGLFLYKGLWGTAGLYVIYVGLVIAALEKWKVDCRGANDELATSSVRP